MLVCELRRDRPSGWFFKIPGFICKRFLPFFPSPSPLFYLRHFSRGLWVFFLIFSSGFFPKWKAPFIFAYTNEIQSVNRHFELPSETNTFSLNTWSRWLCGHNVIYHVKMKTEPDINTASPANFTTTVLRQANWQNRDKNNKQTKSLRSCSPFLKKAGEKSGKKERRQEARYKLLTILF